MKAKLDTFRRFQRIYRAPDARLTREVDLHPHTGDFESHPWVDMMRFGQFLVGWGDPDNPELLKILSLQSDIDDSHRFRVLKLEIPIEEVYVDPSQDLLVVTCYDHIYCRSFNSGGVHCKVGAGTGRFTIPTHPPDILHPLLRISI